jgi:hypothetical protein
MASISRPVGKIPLGTTNANLPQDVKTVQKLLNAQIGKLTPLAPLREDGAIGPNTINVIQEFQRRVVGMPQPDGRVDPGGATLKKLGGTSTASASAAGQATVVYKDTLPSTERIVDPYAFDVIKMVMQNAGCSKGVITSTIRTPEEQVDIMYRNAKTNLAGQYSLYGANGDTVLKIYETNKLKPEVEVKRLMVAKVKELLAKNERVSLHVTTPENYRLRNIIDIGVNSTQAAAGSNFNKSAITEAFKKAERDGYINKFIDETNKSNNCWHVEIMPNIKPLPANL